MLDPTETHETFKEYTKEELYDLYASDNNIPDVIQNYVDELETKLREYKSTAKKIRAFKDIECILNSEQRLDLELLTRQIIKK